MTAVKRLTQCLVIHRTVLADRYQLSARLSFSPLVGERDVNALANDLQNDTVLWRIGGMNHALAAVDVRRQPPGSLAQRSERQGQIGFVAPSTEALRVIVAVAVSTARTKLFSAHREMPGIQLRRVKSANREQYL